MIGPGNKDELYDISDSTDWLDTPLASLAPVDASLRCQVCKDFYKTPMITSCSHTFCSLCIRRCLANDGKCPACRTTEQENKLRSNWAIEGLVDEFIKARPALLNISRRQSRTSGPLSPKRKVDEAELDGQWPDQSRKKTRASSRLSAKSQERIDVVVLDAETDSDDCQPEDGLAACPVCGIRMKVEAIDSHLNRCLIEPSPSRSTPLSGQNNIHSGIPSMQKLPKKLDRLPQLNYSLFKDAALRKKLHELGISAQGSRLLLERRHTEWVTLWNANCDASMPRKKTDLLHELDVWERTQGARVPSSNTGIINPASQILHKDFDGAGWAAKHDLSFQNLIASARKNLAGTTSQPAQSSDTGEGNEQSSEALAIPAMPLPKPIPADTVTDDRSSKLVDQTARNENATNNRQIDG